MPNFSVTCNGDKDVSHLGDCKSWHTEYMVSSNFLSFLHPGYKISITLSAITLHYFPKNNRFGRTVLLFEFKAFYIIL